MPKFQTISFLAGTAACQAKCDFCVSKMTPLQGVAEKGKSEIDFSRVDIACRLAEKSGVATALITGKGEPTLFPEDISSYLRILKIYFPIIELQTNALNFEPHEVDFQSAPDEAVGASKYHKYLIRWRELGLTTIIISVVHFLPEYNQQVYMNDKVDVLDGTESKKKYPDLERTIAYLHKMGFSVRLGCVGCKGFIDDPVSLQQMIDFCKINKVEQLTWRPVTTPDANIQDKDVAHATSVLSIDYEDVRKVNAWVGMNGMKLMTLAHGAEVYDVQGQNLCISSCLTHDADNEEQRQLIYFSDGHIRYSWVYEGAIVL